MKKSIHLLLLTLGIFGIACGANQTTDPDAKPTQGSPDRNIKDKSIEIGGSCTKDSHCKNNNICKDQKCAAPAQPGVCQGDGDCQQNQRCENNTCVPRVDRCAKVSCPENYACTDGACIPQCQAEERCNGGCCANNETCFENACVPKPEKTAGKSDVLCRTTAGGNPIYCPENTGCFPTENEGVYACKKIEHECDKSESFCRIAEYCDSGKHLDTEGNKSRCVRRDHNPNLCKLDVEFDRIPKTFIEWTNSPHEPKFRQVMSTPAVADIIKGEKGSEIIFTTYSSDSYINPGVMRVIAGTPYPGSTRARELWSSASVTPKFYTSPVITPAIGDIDGDGNPDIVIDAFARGGRSGTSDHKNHKLIAITGDGQRRLWEADFGIFYPNYERWSQEAQSFDNRGPQIIDLDSDGHPEIIAQSIIYNHEGKRICSLKESNNKFPSIQAAIDFDGDGRKELVTGNAIFAYEIDQTQTDTDGYQPHSIKEEDKKVCKKISEQTYANISGLSVADLDKDGKPELVGIDINKGIFIETVEKTGENQFERRKKNVIKIPLDYQQAGEKCKDPANASLKDCVPGGGIPNIADFDGLEDNLPEIGVAGRYYYIVAKPDGTILWAHKTRDYSSAVTSSSVFDFDGDGKAEVIYNDEYVLRVFSGEGKNVDMDGDGYNDADIRLEISNTTGTLREYPVVADVNHDGHANLIVGQNHLGRPTGAAGLRVFSEKNNKWVPTRRIWNQFNYYVTNVEDNASIPRVEKENWKLPWLNNALQNVQAGNPFLLPNLVPVIKAVSTPTCTDQTNSSKNIVFDIQNKGDEAVEANSVKYTISALKDGTETIIHVGENQQKILPKSSETIVKENWEIPTDLQNSTFSIKVNLDDANTVQECKEDDNSTIKDNIKGAAPNFKVHINSVSCTSELTVNFEVENDGSQASSTKVKVEVGLTKDSFREISNTTLSNGKEIATGERIAKTFSMDASSYLFRQIYVRVSVNDENKATECNLDDNVAITAQPVLCYLNL